MTGPSSPIPEQPSDPSNKEDNKLENMFKNFKKKVRDNAALDSAVRYTQSNTLDVLAYILMIVGIFLLFFHDFYGGLLIGLVVGRYFSKEIMALCTHINEFVEEQGLVRALVFAGTVLAFFICAPAIFIGAALMIILKALVAA